MTIPGNPGGLDSHRVRAGKTVSATAQWLLMSLYRPATDPKYQPPQIPTTESLEADIVISPDTQRPERLPPGQHRTRKWPVLHATQVPQVDHETWTLSLAGLVSRPQTWTLNEFRQLPRSRVFADFHCVTTWSRLGNLWEGVPLAPLLRDAGLHPNAGFAVIGAADSGWTTNLPLDALMDADVLLADRHDGQPLDAEHGGPVRLVVPRLFAWKSAKWVQAIEITAQNQPGYWEQAGYHNVGDPWRGQRYRDDPEWLEGRATVE